MQWKAFNFRSILQHTCNTSHSVVDSAMNIIIHLLYAGYIFANAESFSWNFLFFYLYNKITTISSLSTIFCLFHSFFFCSTPNNTIQAEEYSMCVCLVSMCNEHPKLNMAKKRKSHCTSTINSCRIYVSVPAMLNIFHGNGFYHDYYYY